MNSSSNNFITSASLNRHLDESQCLSPSSYYQTPWAPPYNRSPGTISRKPLFWPQPCASKHHINSPSQRRTHGLSKFCSLADPRFSGLRPRFACADRHSVSLSQQSHESKRVEDPSMHIVSRRKMTRFNWATQVLTWGSQAAQKLEPFVECAGEVPVVREPGTCICPWLEAIPIQPMYAFTHWLVFYIDDLSRIQYGYWW
ncbi:hypothetical protein J3E69DRAFT_320157 [Trichoderma sp. SZMC 28015]